MTFRPCRAANPHTAAMSHAAPYRWTGITARVRDVTRRSASATSIWNVTRSTATKTGVAPASRTELADPMNVTSGTSTSSPGPTPSPDRWAATREASSAASLKVSRSPEDMVIHATSGRRSACS